MDQQRTHARLTQAAMSSNTGILDKAAAMEQQAVTTGLSCTLTSQIALQG
jgi:hypothetical protein